MTLESRISDRFGIRHPILNAPMGGGDAPAELAAAVSEAGGLGMIGGTTRGGPAWLVEQIRRARALTERPFGVGVISHLPGTDELVDAALREGVPVIAHSFADPSPWMPRAHDHGVSVICQVQTLDGARRAAEAGVDAIVAQGTEAGGHTGMVSTLAFVPVVVDEVAPIPVIAAGGIADGRGIAAVLMLGAEGVWIGTRLLATREAGIPGGYKDRVVAAGTHDTVLTRVFDVAAGIPWPTGISGRAIRNAFTDRWHGDEDRLREWAADHRDEVAGVGEDPDAIALYAGPSAAFVTRTEAAADVVRALAADAESVLRRRSTELLD